jgi:outer membrane biosynthesis protein TonB
VSVSVEPKLSSEFRKAISHVPLFGRTLHAEGGSEFSPARPNRPLDPHLPPSIAEDLSREVSVDVKVSIDKHGAVKNAQLLKGSDFGARGTSDLASAALNNAGATSWEPARQGERSVSSDVIVHYRFSPAN